MGITQTSCLLISRYLQYSNTLSIPSGINRKYLPPSIRRQHRTILCPIDILPHMYHPREVQENDLKCIMVSLSEEADQARIVL
jgi:hypothetical protein